ncbi:MAG: rod shape-determining protein RodA [Spirochaetales bacterium]|nr:rod shape-determining protein RodA [Spirochaetales bacterium]
MKDRSIFEFDFLIFLCTIALMIIGILFIYSSGISSTGVNFSNEYIKQIVWASAGILIMIGFMFFDYAILEGLSRYFYPLMIILLFLTLIFGQVVNGAKSWLSLGPVGIQPSEFTKIATVLFLGRYLEQSKKNPQSLIRFLIAFGICMFPMGLIILQPDMGTAMVYFPIFIVMMFLAGGRVSYLFFVLACAVLSVVIGMLPAWEEYIIDGKTMLLQFLIDENFVFISIGSQILILIVAITGYRFIKKRYFYWISYGVTIFLLGTCGGLVVRKVLKPYQIKRLIVFLDPGIDPQGAGWNVIQSITAVGSGGLWGKGYLKGTQSHYRYLPQQSTDFIFSIISEEWGFIGCIAIFMIFMIILVRSIMILNSSRDTYGLYIGGGIIAIIYFHFIVNIGMAMGIMPITGIPLIFLSYGGSALWTGVIGISLLMNIFNHRYKY